ncbi:DedA family protein [Demequina sp. NBRC 110053]|uniref:DedA family protein n=1 Tax=Demequina sp. NBRC 110053 TaxID=1570342 RepID=UPI00135665C7|nr:DedA family protein [Demequina sp. NBRC 110053]
MTDDRTFSDWLLHFSSTVEEWVLELSESLWIYPGVFVLSLIDGIFPVLPSESVIIATATASFQTGSPILVLIFLCGAAGAWCGDQLAYFVGSKVDVRNWRIFKRDRWRASLDWAETQLERRGTTFIIAARFIPMGRVVVNLSAGALRYPHRRFMGVDAIAVSIWAGWGILLGTAAGAIFPEDNLVLSIVIGVVAGVVLGFFVDKVLGWFGLSQPDLPDLVGEIEESMTPEERARQEELARQRAERREERGSHRAERRGAVTGQIPTRRHRPDPEAPQQDAGTQDRVERER